MFVRIYGFFFFFFFFQEVNLKICRALRARIFAVLYLFVVLFNGFSVVFRTKLVGKAVRKKNYEGAELRVSLTLGGVLKYTRTKLWLNKSSEIIFL